MTYKKRLLSIITIAAIGGIAYYFLKTNAGRQEWKRIRGTAEATADTFKTFGEEVARNVTEEKKEVRSEAAKAFLQEVLTT